MRTRRLDVESNEEASVQEAAEILVGGGLVAFPTETVYGLGALGLDTACLRKVFAAKERPLEDPLIQHVADPSWLDDLAGEVPAPVRALVERFWPGPLTVILSKSPKVPDLATAGLPSVAARMPMHPLALALIGRVGAPLAAPSANSFGRPSPTTAEHVLEDLDGRIDAVLDGGPTEVGVESTVVDARRPDRPVIVRPGGVTREAIEATLGVSVPVRKSACERSEPTVSPGLLSRHYSPRTLLRIFAEPPSGGAPQAMLAAMKRAGSAKGAKVAVLAYDEDVAAVEPLADILESVGSSRRPQGVAMRLFAALRRLDASGATVIFARLLPPGGLGETINDRLKKAAGGKVE